MVQKIGAITVGQSPRVDVVPEIMPLLGGVELIQRGALDGMSKEAIAAIHPQENDYVLVTRLADGSSVQIAEKHILPRIQAHIDQLISEGVVGILMLCTGEFPAFVCSKPLLYPQVLLQHFTVAVAGKQKLGVLSPAAAQLPQSTRRWKLNGIDNLAVDACTPYGPTEEVVAAAVRLQAQGAELFVLDCIGYTLEMKRQIQQATGSPVILPRTVAARAVAELFQRF